MKSIIISALRAYQKYISPDQSVMSRGKTTCVFYPTCSEYSAQAVEKYGVLKGLFLSLRRILRCHPWQKNHHNPLV